MPYAKTKDNRLVNEVTLGDGYPLSNDLQPLKVGGEASPIEMSTSLPDDSDNAKVKVRGDLEVTGGLNFKNDVEVDLSFDDLSLSGNLTISGTVDGRDVATDGTKLDGIEASATADQTQADINGLAITTTGALDSGSITSGFGNIDTGSSTITTTGAITGGSFVGQSVWVEYPFIVTNGVAGRPYYRDVDDLYGDFRKWDDYDTSPTTISRGDVAGHYVVPENCTLKHMRAVVSNASSGGDIIIAIYHGTPTLNSSAGTSLALAGSENTVSVSTVTYNYAANVDFDVNLDAGDIIVPMVEHNEGSNQTFRGNLTLKLVTR
jgi:hypothetical protein